MSENLPAIPSPQDDHINSMLERKRLAALAEQALKFRRSASDSLDELLPNMIRENHAIGWNKFTKPNGRPCILIVGVGPDATGQLTDAVYTVTHPEESPDEKNKDSRE